MKKYDFALNWDGTVREYFVDCLIKFCKEKKLSFLWISSQNSKSVLKDLIRHKMKIGVLLDTEATHNKEKDTFSRICYAVKDVGGVVINDPDRTIVAINKAVMHYELINAGITTPYTIVVRNWEPNYFILTPEERKNLKTPFVIKPALGYGQQGVIKDARGSIKEIASARNFDKGDNFLLQEKIYSIELGGKYAWFRVFNVFDTIIPCWWDDRHNLYEHVAYEEFNHFRLFALAKIVSKIASITNMVWFSTEIAIDMKNGKMRFLPIDYVNDQCDMSAKSETTSGVPNPIVEHTAYCIVDIASRLVKGDKHSKISKKYTIWLKNATIEIRGLGTSPELLRQNHSE